MEIKPRTNVVVRLSDVSNNALKLCSIVVNRLKNNGYDTYAKEVSHKISGLHSKSEAISVFSEYVIVKWVSEGGYLMKYNNIVNISPKGDVVCYDKNGTLRDDLNIYQLSKQDQLEIFGEIMIHDAGQNSEKINNDKDLIVGKDGKVLRRKLGLKLTWTDFFKDFFKRK